MLTEAHVVKLDQSITILILYSKVVLLTEFNLIYYKNERYAFIRKSRHTQTQINSIIV